jgi:hypothetical protein
MQLSYLLVNFRTPKIPSKNFQSTDMAGFCAASECMKAYGAADGRCIPVDG